MELQTSPRQVLDGIKETLDTFDALLVPRGERLECAQLARGLASRLTVLSAVLLAKADAAQESLQQSGTPTTSWLTIQGGLSKREAAALEERDPAGAGLTPEQRRADALVAMIINHGEGRRAPKVGGDRPRVVVTVDYAKLLADATGAGLIGDGEPLSAGDLRRLCCDADLLPAVLGGPSAVLDVGRDSRLVTPEMRAALVLRDGGCVFPGCHARPSECEAHHVIPWLMGGVTALWNLVLLCHHHHGLVEPARYAVRDQWEIRIGTDGIPETIPPRRCDPERGPLRHARHQTGQDPGAAIRPETGHMDEFQQTG